MLTDRQIRQAIAEGHLQVKPVEGIDARIQPASLDVRLGSIFITLDKRAAPYIDPRENQAQDWQTITVEDGDYFTIHPGELVLANTVEKIGLSDQLVARVEGKSSLGRLGILVHATAGFVDPGWPLASITLEISTVIDVPVRLYPGMPIGQLAFEMLDEPVGCGYTGRYTGQEGPAVSRFHQNWTGTRWM